MFLNRMQVEGEYDRNKHKYNTQFYEKHQSPQNSICKDPNFSEINFKD